MKTIKNCQFKGKSIEVFLFFNFMILLRYFHYDKNILPSRTIVITLQMNGFEVDFINSVQFSNHAGNVFYKSLPTSNFMCLSMLVA